MSKFNIGDRVIKADTEGHGTITMVMPYNKRSGRQLYKVRWQDRETDEFEVFAGKGLSAVLNGKKIYGGNEAFIRTRISIPDEMLKKSEELSELGKTPLFFSSGENFAGLIAVSDVIREDSTEAVRELKNMNIKVVM